MRMAQDPRITAELGLLSLVAETGSFGRAGARIGLTQSGVSRAVARLEERVGVRLFDRHARAVTLTDEGKRLQAASAPLLSAIADAIEGVADGAGRVRGRLRINIDPFFARFVMAPRLHTFLAAHPELQLELVVRDRLGDLVAEGFDAAVRFGEPEPSGIVARRLLATRMLTCAAPSYIAAHGRPKHPRDVANGHECILFTNPHTGHPFEWEFHQGTRRIRNVPVRGRLVVNDVAASVGACVAGHGIAQLKELSTRDLVRDGQLVDLFPRWSGRRSPLYVLHPSRHLPPAKVRAFVDFVVASSASIA